MKKQPLKNRKILQLLQTEFAGAAKFFIPPSKVEEKSLKNRVKVLPKRKAWSSVENSLDKGS